LTEVIGACRECSAPLAAEQRYCVQCGLRTEPFGAPFLRFPEPQVAGGAAAAAGGPAWLPPPKSLSLYAAMALAFGMVIGTALEPGLAGIQAAAPQVIVMPGEETPPEEVVDSGSGGGSGAGGGGGAPAAASGSTFIPSSGSPSPSPAPPPPRGGNKHQQKPQRTTLTGTVVHVNPAARSYAITHDGAQLTAIHSGDPPEPGTTVEVPVRTLANQTYRELKGRKRTGSEDSAAFTGNVTFTGDIPGESASDPPVRVYTVSSRGVSVLVRMPADESLEPPSPGDSVSVEVDLIEPPKAAAAKSRERRHAEAAAAGGCASPNGPRPDPPVEPDVFLTQTKLTVAEEISPKHADLEAVIQGCPDGKTVVISADDIRESSQDLTLTVSPDSGIDLSKLIAGQSIAVTAERDDGQPFTRISGLSSDQGASGANDFSTAQGDQA